MQGLISTISKGFNDAMDKRNRLIQDSVYKGMSSEQIVERGSVQMLENSQIFFLDNMAMLEVYDMESKIDNNEVSITFKYKRLSKG